MKSRNISALIVLFLCAMIFAFSGCGDDNPAAPEDDGGNELPPNTPPIPVPTHPAESLPDRSDSLIVDERYAITFAPANAAAPDTIAAITGQPENTIRATDQRVTLVDESVITDPVIFPVLSCASGGGICINPTVGCNGVVHAPVVQRIRYWEKIFSTTIMYPANYLESHTYTEGTSETTGESFSYTLGASGGAFGISLSAELTRTFEHSITVSSETSVTKQFSCSSIEGKTLVCTAWQLVEGYRICNADSTTYTDRTWNHMIIPAIDNATTTVYLSVVEFD
jgi:hypothetical protein